MTINETLLSTMANPVIIGATGGSGTRCVASIMLNADSYLGWNLNKSHDSLSLTPFLRRHMIEAYKHMEDLPPEQVERWKVDFASAFSRHLLKYGGQEIWGWKNPTSMFLTSFFSQVFPRMKFIHLVRDGRDMALSQNSNQYRAFNCHADRDDIGAKAAFWSVSNTKVKRTLERELRDNYLLVRFEDLCNDPESQIDRILEFIGSSASIDSCTKAVRKPDSIGRYQALSRAQIQQLSKAAENGLVEFGYV